MGVSHLLIALRIIAAPVTPATLAPLQSRSDHQFRRLKHIDRFTPCGLRRGRYCGYRLARQQLLA